ncbi:MAG: hypothetical protein E7218_05125 [Anaerofustis stercorihominis]|nr:hypothetical protein [Anaerofustis stercorihominis]
MAKRRKIASLEEIAVFWTEILRSEDSDLKDKLKVSELLIKALGGSIEIKEESKEKPMNLEECYRAVMEVIDMGSESEE